MNESTGFISTYDQASISVARARVRELGTSLGLEKNLIEQVAIIASELLQNQLLHARYGEFLVQKVSRNGITGLEVIARDKGPGIKDPKSALRGELSTSGSMGQGLSSVRGLADELDFNVRLGQGTCIWARKFAKPTGNTCCELAVLGRPYPGEAVNGDVGGFFRTENGFLASVADGLGHGLLANEASSRAMTIVAENTERGIPEILIKCNRELTTTRGAVMSLIRFDGSTQKIDYCGTDDISTHLYYLREQTFFPSTPHTLGGVLQTSWNPQVSSATVKSGAVLICFTDGFKTGTTIAGRLDLFRQPAIVIAQTLLEEFVRINDDALVLVARFSCR